MTMVEIIVAFVMLALVMAILYSCIQFASNIMKTAVDVDRNNQDFESAVVAKFKKTGSYELGTSGNVTYSFEEKNADGTNGSVKCDVQVYTAKVGFEKTASGYVESTATSGDNLRRIYMFSTGGAGSSSTGDEVRHTLTYMIQRDGESGFTEYDAVEFIEGKGVATETAVTAPEGKTFDGWYFDTSFSSTSRAADLTAITMTAVGDITVYGRYVSKAATTSYTIEYLGQRPDGTANDLLETARVDGVTPGAAVTLSDSQKKSFAGFTLDENNSILSTTISADGSTVFKLYYTRETYVLTYVIMYPDDTSRSVVSNFTYGAYLSNGEKITELMTTDSNSSQTITGWYDNEECTGEPYTLTMLEQANSSVSLYTKLKKKTADGGVGVDNMENETEGNNLSDKLPELNEVPQIYRNNFWAGLGPYDNGSSHDNYLSIRDDINEALKDFGYSTGNVYLSSNANGNMTKLYIMDSNIKGIPNINADMTKDEIAYMIAGEDYVQGQFSTKIEIPENAVAVYETTLNTYTSGGYGWKKIEENSKLYLDVYINRGNYNNGKWDYWGFTVKITE